MIGSSFYICVAISIFFNTLSLILKSSRAEQIIKVFRTVIDLIILYILVSGVLGINIPSVEFQFQDEKSLLSVKSESEKNVVNYAEQLLQQEICEAIEKETGKTPSRCIAEIDCENFELDSLTVYFKSCDFSVSGYSLKRMLKEIYEVDAEVILE